MLLLGILLFMPIAFAGHADNLRVNTFLAEAFPGEGNSRKFYGLNSDNESCEVRFTLNNYLHVDDAKGTESAPLYDVKVTKIDNLNSLSFYNKRENGPNWFGDRRRIYKTEAGILKTRNGYKFKVTLREGRLNKIRSQSVCTINL